MRMMADRSLLGQLGCDELRFDLTIACNSHASLPPIQQSLQWSKDNLQLLNGLFELSNLKSYGFEIGIDIERTAEPVQGLDEISEF